MSLSSRAVARIDLGAIERNCARLPKPLCAVVKANAYGHGTVPVAEAALAGGAEWLAVATAEEATELRGSGIDARLLVMGALTADELRTVVEADADVVAWTEEIARDNGLEACSNILTIARGEVPSSVVNKEVIDRPGFQAKLARFRRSL